MKGSFVLVDAFSFVSSGRYTSLNDLSPLGKFISSLMKCDVAPESKMIRRFCLRATRRVHLFSFCVVVTVVHATAFNSFVVSFDSSSSSLSSGVQ